MLGLWNFYFARAEFQTARVLGQEIVHLAQTAGDPNLLARAHAILGEMWFHIGDLVTARSYLDQGLAIAVPRRHWARTVQPPQVTCGCYVALALWMAGYPDQAVQRVQVVFTLAQELAHEQSFPFWLSFGMILRGWALTRQGQSVEGLANIREGLALCWPVQESVVMRRNCIASGIKCSARPLSTLTRIRMKLRRIFSTPSASPASNSPKPGNDALPQVALDMAKPG